MILFAINIIQKLKAIQGFRDIFQITKKVKNTSIILWRRFL